MENPKNHYFGGIKKYKKKIKSVPGKCLMTLEAIVSKGHNAKSKLVYDNSDDN